MTQDTGKILSLRRYVMPGIFGCVGRRGKIVDSKLASKMADYMKHDEMYISEWIVTPGIFGAVELLSSHKKSNRAIVKDASIIAVTSGHVYFNDACEDRTQGSSSSMSEKMVKLYKKYELKFVRDLNGLFVVAIYDEENARIVIANDRYGYCPLFYSFNSNSLVFSSEVGAVLKDKNVVAKLEKNAVPEFFAFSFLLGDKTFFKGVNRLKPATVLTYDIKTDKLALLRYWDFKAKKPDPNKSLEDHVCEFSKLMKHAVENAVQDRDEVGIFLSGGLDSRIIAAFASQTKTPAITFTFGTKNCLERKIAAEIAENLGLENIFYEIPSDLIKEYAKKVVYRSGGLIRIRDCHFIAWLEHVRKKVDTVLLGTFGGDLVWPLSLSNRLIGLESREEIIDYLKEFYTSNVLPVNKHKKAFSTNFFRETEGAVEKNLKLTFEEIKFSQPSDIADYWEYRNREPNYIFTASQYINWYLETRHPFMDNNLVEFLAFRFPPHMRRKEIFGMVVEDTFLQRTINKNFPSLAKIPWKGFPPNPSMGRILYEGGRRFIRKKVSPRLAKLLHRKIGNYTEDYRGYDEWLRTGSKDYALRILLDPRTMERNIFREDFINSALKAHMSYAEDWNQLICDLINFELLNRFFLDKSQE